MRIGLIGPVTPTLLDFVREGGVEPPRGHNFGMNADLVNGLIARGHEVHVFTATTRGKVPFEYVASPHGLTMIPIGGRRAAIHFYLPEIRALADAIERHGPFDVVHAHWLYEYALAALRTAYPTLVTMHDWPWLILKNDFNLQRTVKFILSKLVERKVRHVATPSIYMTRVATEVFGFENVFTVANGISESSLASNHKSFPPRAILLAVNIGFDRRKNVAALLRAFAQVRRNAPRARLRLVGEEYETGGSAYQFAATQGLIDGVAFLGRLDRRKVLDEMAAATLFVHPSIEESFGLVLIEAMSQKLPVMGGAKSGAVPWLLDEGRAGYLSDVTNPQVLARDILTAIAAPSELAAKGLVGFKRVAENFVADRMIDHYVACYEQLRTRSVQ